MTLTLLAVTATTMAVVGLTVLLLRGRHTAELSLHAAPIERQSIHVLRTEEELRAAVQRAASFDRRAAQTLHTRSTRYQELISAPPQQ